MGYGTGNEGDRPRILPLSPPSTGPWGVSYPQPLPSVFPIALPPFLAHHVSTKAQGDYKVTEPAGVKMELVPRFSIFLVSVSH